LLLSLSYCISAGVFALGVSAENGIDLAVCYVAGVTTERGSSPYNYAELTHTRNTLSAALASKPSYPFAYPPSVLPACVLLSRLPWELAQAVWKLLNVAFLAGSVLLTFWLFRGLSYTLVEKYLVWSFAFIFSPTVSVLLVGQSSLFVLFTGLSSIVLSHRQKPWSAGFGLALAFTKPHLTFPLALLLLCRWQYKTVIAAIAIFAVAVLLGLQLGHSDIHGYVEGLRGYASTNIANNPRLVGIQNLATGVLALSPPTGRILSGICGLAFLGMVLAFDRNNSSWNRSEHALPLVLLVSVLTFGAHSYDLVLLIPLCMWAIGKSREDTRFLPIVILCFILIIPLGLVKITYQRLLSHFLPSAVYQVVIQPYRSWILLILSVFVIQLIWRRVPWRKRADTTERLGGCAG
jgi:hypothetical protein